MIIFHNTINTFGKETYFNIQVILPGVYYMNLYNIFHYYQDRTIIIIIYLYTHLLTKNNCIELRDIFIFNAIIQTCFF